LIIVQVAAEDGLVVPEDEAFLLKFLRAGLMEPEQGLQVTGNRNRNRNRKYIQVMRNFFKLRLSKPEYFQVNIGPKVARIAAELD
jgi:hypothetical protein